MPGLPRAMLLLFALATLAGAASLPRPASEFVIRGPRGEVLLSQFQGKVALLEFIHTTCPHCQRSIAVVNEIQKEYGPRGFQALASAFNELAPQGLADFLTRFQPAFPCGYSTRATVFDFLQLPPNFMYSVPIFVFIDKKGSIREQHIGNEPFFKDLDKNIRATVDTLLKEPAQTKKPVRKAQ
jgi:thiol-disulfide isomerase/thioredoxin